MAYHHQPCTVTTGSLLWRRRQYHSTGLVQAFANVTVWLQFQKLLETNAFQELQKSFILNKIVWKYKPIIWKEEQKVAQSELSDSDTFLNSQHPPPRFLSHIWLTRIYFSSQYKTFICRQKDKKSASRMPLFLPLLQIVSGGRCSGKMPCQLWLRDFPFPHLPR